MTALWEQALESIEKGEITMETFLTKQMTWIAQLVNQYKHVSLNITATEKLSCPRCSASLKKIKGKHGSFWSCSHYPDCTYTQNIGKQTKRKQKTTSKK